MKGMINNMTVLERLKIELNHKDYFTDEEYTMYLQENELTSTDNYDKSTMQRGLLLTIIDILEAVSNDVDLMRTIADGTTNMSIGECLKLLQSRINDIKDRIATLPIDSTDTDDNGNFGIMFTRGY
jgi:hypothetical protein